MNRPAARANRCWQTDMTTRMHAAIAEKLDQVADEMRAASDVIRARSSRTPEKPHLVALARSARVAALMLRAHMPDSDRAMHLAGELIGVGCGLREWADYAPCASVDRMRAENLRAVAGFVSARAQELRS